MRDAVQAARACFRTHFPRERAVILAADRDVVPPATERTPDEGAVRPSSSGLRTVHTITVTAATLDDDGGPVRLLLSAADLLQARAVVVLDPSIAGVRPDRIATLAAPVVAGQADLVAPMYHRAADEGLLVTQLVRPLVRAIHGHRLREPLIPEFGCSGALATHCTQQAWTLSRQRLRSNYWIAAEALSGPFTLQQRDLGPRCVAAGGPAPKLANAFAAIVGSVFAAFSDTSASWIERAGSDEVPIVGAPAAGPPSGSAAQEGGHLLASFATDVQNLKEILIDILGGDTFASVLAAATRAGGPAYPDALWADTLARFVVAFHHGVMRREHVTSALLPLYLARTGDFLVRCGGADGGDLDAALESLSARVEEVKPGIVERWANQHEVTHG